jgi:hypothetical protein
VVPAAAALHGPWSRVLRGREEIVFRTRSAREEMGAAA